MKAKRRRTRTGDKKGRLLKGHGVSGSEHGTDTRERVTRKTVRLYTYYLLTKSGGK